MRSKKANAAAAEPFRADSGYTSTSEPTAVMLLAELAELAQLSTELVSEATSAASSDTDMSESEKALSMTERPAEPVQAILARVMLVTIMVLLF